MVRRLVDTVCKFDYRTLWHTLYKSNAEPGSRFTFRISGDPVFSAHGEARLGVALSMRTKLAMSDSIHLCVVSLVRSVRIKTNNFHVDACPASLLMCTLTESVDEFCVDLFRLRRSACSTNVVVVTVYFNTLAGYLEGRQCTSEADLPFNPIELSSVTTSLMFVSARKNTNVCREKRHLRT